MARLSRLMRELASRTVITTRRIKTVLQPLIAIVSMVNQVCLGDTGLKANPTVAAQSYSQKQYFVYNLQPPEESERTETLWFLWSQQCQNINNLSVNRGLIDSLFWPQLRLSYQVLFSLIPPTELSCKFIPVCLYHLRMLLRVPRHCFLTWCRCRNVCDKEQNLARNAFYPLPLSNLNMVFLIQE